MNLTTTLTVDVVVDKARPEGPPRQGKSDAHVGEEPQWTIGDEDPRDRSHRPTDVIRDALDQSGFPRGFVDVDWNRRDGDAIPACLDDRFERSR